MRYYIRHDKNAKVEGPFTIEELTEAIRSGRIPSDALASSDLGDDVADLQPGRSCDWFPLAAIAELREVVPPTPAPVSQPRRVSLFAVACYLVAAVSLSYSAITERRWFASLLAVPMVFYAVDSMVRYARQSKKSNEAA